MNILFFITPKSDVAYIYDDFTLRQVLEKMETRRFAAVPMLNHEGIYIGTVSEGDLLREIKKKHNLSLQDAENVPIYSVERRSRVDAVNINCEIEDLVSLSLRQNFVPVVDDDGVFIGIIRRKDIIEYFYNQALKK